MVPQLEGLLKTCLVAARSGAAAIAECQNNFSVREKGPADLVTSADEASELAIRRAIREAFPSHAFLGEESGDDGLFDSEAYCWVADPIDGTTNFVHSIPIYCVSVAVRHDDQSIVGVILDPCREETFSAMLGRGLMLNNRVAPPPRIRDLSDAVLAISLPPRLDGSDWEFESLKRLVPKCRAFRRTGSAALNLCYIAMGRFDGYWATSLNLWDRAAGELFVRESGGVVTDLNGDPLRSSSTSLVASTNHALHEKLLAELRAAQSS